MKEHSLPLKLLQQTVEESEEVWWKVLLEKAEAPDMELKNYNKNKQKLQQNHQQQITTTQLLSD